MSSRGLVLHVTTTDISLALLLGPQLRAFADAGFDVLTASAPGPYVEQLTSWGIEHRPLRHATRSHAPHRDVLALKELYKLFREVRPDIVHTHNPKPGIYGRVAARAARVPCVVNTVHGLYATPEDRFARRAVVYTLERGAALCSDAELVQNPEDLETLARLGVPRRKLHLLGNGIDLTRFDPARVDPASREALRRAWGAGADDVVCGLVGRLVWEKGYREVFAAAAALRERVPGLRFVVVGPTDPEKSDAITGDAMALAERTGNVTFLGARDDVERLYAAMDVYVLASHREGFPRSAMEAAAMGLPVVATDIRGCREVVDHGTTGLLVPSHDAAALAAAIESLARDASLRRNMGETGIKKAQGAFDDREVIDRTLTVYAALLSRPKAARSAPNP